MTLANLIAERDKLEAMIASPDSYSVTGSHSVTLDMDSIIKKINYFNRKIALYQGYTSRTCPDLSGGGATNDY